MKLDDQVAQIKAAIADANSAQLAAIDRVAVDVTELQNRVSNGQAIADTDFASIIDGLNAMKAQVAAVDPLPDFPAPPPAA